jgi:hypothetical protein
VKSTDLAAGIKVTLGGPIDPTLLAQLVEVRVETTTAIPDVCTLRFTEADPDGTDGLKVIDDTRFKLGAPVSVQLAAPVGNAGLKPVFEGEITTVEAELGSRLGGEPILELVVTAHDNSHRMHRKTTTRTFRQMTVADVARKMAGEHGLRLGKLATLKGGPAATLHQVGETDWAFLSQHGGELDVAGGSLHVIDPAAPKAQVAELVWGETLERFRPRVSSVGQLANVTVSAWDAKSKKTVTGTAKPKASTTVENAAVDKAVTSATAVVATAMVSNKSDADAAAVGIATRLGHERVQAEARATGDPRLLAGEYVKISGVGKRFGGVHRIVSAVHSYGARGYKTRLVLGAGGRPLAETLNGNGHNGAGFADHLVVGLVTDNKDPDDLARVKVRYPVFGQDVESDWARVVREASGAARGAVALPHVNDEVVVGFHDGDIRRPFVLGALFNGMDKPGADLVKATSSVAARYPRDLDVATKQKALLTADTGLTIKTTNGPVEVSAGAAMKLEASAGGPPSELTIKTTGKINMKGDLGIEITATGPLKITSQAPVTVESNAALQLKGSVIQVQATGILQLSGATVMIG